MPPVWIIVALVTLAIVLGWDLVTGWDTVFGWKQQPTPDATRDRLTTRDLLALVDVTDHGLITAHDVDLPLAGSDWNVHDALEYLAYVESLG